MNKPLPPLATQQLRRLVRDYGQAAVYDALHQIVTRPPPEPQP